MLLQITMLDSLPEDHQARSWLEKRELLPLRATMLKLMWRAVTRVSCVTNWKTLASFHGKISLQDAKQELIRIFYGGRPTTDIPFMRKLCDEVHKASIAILQHPSSSRWRDLYARRKNPEFSQLAAILSWDERRLVEEFDNKVGNKMRVMIFDGGFVECNSLSDEIDILHACCAVSDDKPGCSLKSWPTRSVLYLPRAAVRSGKAEAVAWPTPSSSFENCLLIYVINNLVPEVDLSRFVDMSFEEGLSAYDFNTYLTGSSQRALNAGHRLVHVPDARLQDLADPKTKWICFQGEETVISHWWGVEHFGENKVRILDSSAGPRCLIVSLNDFLEFCSGFHDIFFFECKSVPHSDQVSNSHPYCLRGHGDEAGGFQTGSAMMHRLSCAASTQQEFNVCVLCCFYGILEHKIRRLDSAHPLGFARYLYASYSVLEMWIFVGDGPSNSSFCLHLGGCSGSTSYAKEMY